MSKLNQIQNELKQINEAKFQELCDSFLYKLGYSNIEPFGSMAGKEKTVKGTPDSFIRQPNGKYIFVEHTTNEKNLLNKLTKDLDKCFNESTTGIPTSKIEKIIVCHNSKLSPEDEEKLAQKCAEHNCLFEQFGIGKLSLALSQDFPILAKTFLGVEMDTGQILSPEDFIDEYQKNTFATPLNTTFHFREEELGKIENAIETQDIIVIAGRAGVGKSRLALEMCRQFTKKHTTFKTYCIFNKRLPIYENLKAYFAPDSNYLVFVDDANRLSELEHILYLLKDKSENRRVKIIITVRDYALNKINESLRDYLNKETIAIEPFKNEQIRKLVEDEFGIKYHLYLNRISQIAKGNPRLAMMAGELADKTQKFESITDASSLYEEYFSTITKDLDELGNKNLLIVAGIISFFGSIDRANNNQIKEIVAKFQLSEEVLWAKVQKLHELEIVDLYENEVAKISDQVLATYLFYRVFFQDELLDFSILLKNYSNNYRFDDAVFPVINTFNNDFVYSKLQKYIDKRWEEIKDNEAELLHLADRFWFLKQADTLLYLKQTIDNLPIKEYEISEFQFEPNKNDVSDIYLRVLENFQRATTENFKIALNLIFNYLEKCPEALSQVLYLLLERFCFHVNSYVNGYSTQKTVIDFLVDKAKNTTNNLLYRRILLRIAGKYLKTYFHSTWSESRNTISWTNFGLIDCQEIFEIRAALLQFLVDEYAKNEFTDDVLQIIVDYSDNIYEKHLEENTNNIIKEDSKILLPFLTSILSPSSYRDCVIAQTYFRLLEKRKVRFDKSLKKKFTNKTYRISKVLSPQRWELYGLYGEERDKYKRRVIEKFFADWTYEDYVRFFESCQIIKQHESKDNSYGFELAIGRVLDNLAETNTKLFKEILEYILKSGNQLSYVYPNAIQHLISNTPNLRDVYNLLQKYDYNSKFRWLFAFLTQLSSDQVSAFYLNELYELYRSADLQEVFIYFDSLANYAAIDPKVLSRVVKILFERAHDSEDSVRFDLLFNPYGEIVAELKILFEGEIDLLKDVYLYEISIDRHADYRGETLKTILEIDPNFIAEYLEYITANEERLSTRNGGQRYSALWELENYESIISTALEYILRMENSRFFFGESYANIFFRYEAKTSASEKDLLMQQRMEDFVSNYIKSYHKDSERMMFIFDIVKHSFHNKRAYFLEIFLQLNKKFEDFRRLNIEPHSWSSMGSRIPVFERKIEFLKSILPLFTSIEFLKHKICVENEILYWKGEIQDANKEEFVSEF